MPLVGRWKLGHRFNMAFVAVLLAGVAYLTVAAVNEDYRARWTDPARFAELVPTIEAVRHRRSQDRRSLSRTIRPRSRNTKTACGPTRATASRRSICRPSTEAEREAERIVDAGLRARANIPTVGAITLLRNDPRRKGRSCSPSTAPVATRTQRRRTEGEPTPVPTGHRRRICTVSPAAPGWRAF